MQRLIVLLIVAALGWYGYTKYQARTTALKAAEVESPSVSPRPSPPSTAAAPEPAPAPTEARYKCDGRTYCSQMTSCEEAYFFLRNCPGVKMDGNNDGIPCEKQWCKR